MLYFANASTGPVSDAMRAGHLGQIVTPAEGRAPLEGVTWCADNSAFAGKYPGDEQFLAWLDRLPHRGRCRFAVAPDVVGDAAATLDRSGPMLPAIRAAGFPVALAAQNGLENLWVPWPDFDVLFIGGDTAWKLSGNARRLTAEARARGKWVHMGRVNSLRRLRTAAWMGCDSADGTYLIKGPDLTGLPNPEWVEWLMGFPPGWTDCDHWETPLFPRSPSTSDDS